MAAIAGGITGSEFAVVAFIALAVIVTLARRYALRDCDTARVLTPPEYSSPLAG